MTIEITALQKYIGKRLKELDKDSEGVVSKLGSGKKTKLLTTQVRLLEIGERSDELTDLAVEFNAMPDFDKNKSEKKA
jgi:hypothetical protein